MPPVRFASVVTALTLVTASALASTASALAAATPTLIGVRADSLTAPRFDSTSAGIATVPVDLGPQPERHRKSSRWAQLLGPQVLGSFPVSHFGHATSPGAGIGIQLLVLGMRPWLAFRGEMGFTQHGSRETAAPVIGFFGDTFTVHYQSHNDVQWISVGPQFEHGLGRARCYAFTTAGVLRIRPVQDGDFNALFYGPTDPAGTNTGFCLGIGGGVRWPVELFPHILFRLEGEYLSRSNAKYVGDPPYVGDGAGGSRQNMVRGHADLASVHLGILIQP